MQITVNVHYGIILQYTKSVRSFPVLKISSSPTTLPDIRYNRPASLNRRSMPPLLTRLIQSLKATPSPARVRHAFIIQRTGKINQPLYHCMNDNENGFFFFRQRERAAVEARDQPAPVSQSTRTMKLHNKRPSP